MKERKKPRTKRKTVYFIILIMFMLINNSKVNSFSDIVNKDQKKIIPISCSRKNLAYNTKESFKFFIGSEKKDQVRLRDFQPTKKEQQTNKVLDQPLKRVLTQTYIESEPISISSDFQLNNSGFKGNGTVDDPIRIEGFNITASSESLISISSTTYYFSITNCFLNGLNSSGQGISLTSVTHGIIENNYIMNNTWAGIQLSNSYNNTINNNTLFDHHLGIRFESASEDNFIRNNTVFNSNLGISLLTSSNNSIRDNQVHNNHGLGCWIESSSDRNCIENNSVYSNLYDGLCLSSSDYNIITHNTVSDNGRGFNLETSHNNTIDTNTASSNSKYGIQLSESNFNWIDNNTLHYNGGGINIDSSEDNMISRNTIAYCHKVEGISSGGGVNLGGKRNNISDNLIYGCDTIGVWTSTTDHTISGNRIFNNSEIGIGVGGNNNVISDNTINGGDGIGVGGNNNIISYNILSGNGTTLGISLGASMFNIISNNTITNSFGGIYLLEARYNNITSNIVFENNFVGIVLEYISGESVEKTENNRIVRNVVYNNDEGGIAIWGEANNNIISENLIMDSINIGGVNNLISHNDITGEATDDGSENIFTENYWRDWTETGVYLIGGFTGNQDSSPLINPFHISTPIITSPTHNTLTLTDNITIQWIPSTDIFGHFLTYSLFYSTDDGGNWTALTSGLTNTNYTLDTTTIANEASIRLKIHAIDSLGFIAKTVSIENFFIDNREDNPNFLLLQVLLTLLLVGCAIAAGYYIVNTQFRTPSFTDFFQVEKFEFLKPIYHKVIIGLESIQTAIMSEVVVTPLLEEPTMPTSLITWFPDDYRIELKSKLKGRTILTLIEIAFQYSEDANLTKLAQSLDIPASTLSDELKKLIKLNYLDFHVTPRVLHDGRYRHYIITAKGISFLKILKNALELSIRRAKEKEQFN